VTVTGDPAAQDLRRRLVHELAMVQAGMLGVPGSGLHPQPMFHLTIPGEALIWFMAEADSDLLAAIGNGTAGRYLLTGHRHDLHASLCGRLTPAPDRQGLERVWSVAAETRFPGGLGDLDWVPLRFALSEAAVWASPQPALMTGMDMILSGLAPAADDPQVAGTRAALLRFDAEDGGGSSNI
jgi:general stress protein 26